MLNQQFIHVVERLHGKKIATLLGEQIGSERTARNWLNGITKPDAMRVAAIRDEERRKFCLHLKRRGWPENDIDKYADRLFSAAGLLSGTIISVSVESRHIHEQSAALAGRIDEISQQLTELRQGNHINAIVSLLLDSDLIVAEHLMHPEIDGPEGDQRTRLEAATSFSQLALPLAVVAVNLHLQLLATLDLEFCTGYLKKFSLRPVFLCLMPRPNPEADSDSEGLYHNTKDLFHLPVRRLLELMICLREWRVNGHWPAAIPSVGEMAVRMQCEPQALTKWRMGRQFRYRDYENLWTALYSGSASPPHPPGAPAIAALLLTELCIKGRRETGDLRMIVPDDETYVRWWRYQKAAIMADGGLLTCGDLAWMPGLFGPTGSAGTTVM